MPKSVLPIAARSGAIKPSCVPGRRLSNSICLAWSSRILNWSIDLAACQLVSGSPDRATGSDLLSEDVKLPVGRNRLIVHVFVFLIMTVAASASARRELWARS